MDRDELYAKYGSKRVFVVENQLFDESFEVFTRLYNPNLYESILEYVGKFHPRFDAELNPQYRQIIPYCLIKCGSFYFITRRKDGDARLIGKYSLGIGGHIEPCDNSKMSVNEIMLRSGNTSTSMNLMKKALMREIHEELDLESHILSINLQGLLYSNQTEVDSVHIGLVYVAEIDGLNVEVRETDTLSGEWVMPFTIRQLLAENSLESWSKICAEHLILDRG